MEYSDGVLKCTHVLQPTLHTIMEKQASARMTLKPSAYQSMDISVQRPSDPLRPYPPPDVVRHRPADLQEQEVAVDDGQDTHAPK